MDGGGQPAPVNVQPVAMGPSPGTWGSGGFDECER